MIYDTHNPTPPPALPIFPIWLSSASFTFLQINNIHKQVFILVTDHETYFGVFHNVLLDSNSHFKGCGHSYVLCYPIGIPASAISSDMLMALGPPRSTRSLSAFTKGGSVSYSFSALPHLCIQVSALSLLKTSGSAVPVACLVHKQVSAAMYVCDCV